MSTSQNRWLWSTTASDNDDADSGINWAEGMDPGAVNNSARAMMAAIAKAEKDQGGALVAGGSATALTVTTNTGLESGNIGNGLTLMVRTASAATGAATIAIDGLTAVNIKKNDGSAIASGDWASGAILVLVYSSAASAFIAANIGPAYSLDVNSLTAETAIDHAADYIPFYDNSASGNRKVLPRYLAPSVRASFSAHKNGTSQTISTTNATKITFGTEVFDVGSFYASSTWTPPAGTCLISAQTIWENLGSSSDTSIHLYKNGSIFKSYVMRSDNAGAIRSASLTVVDQCNGTDYYEVYNSSTDNSYKVVGNADYSFFMGTMI